MPKPGDKKVENQQEIEDQKEEEKEPEEKKPEEKKAEEKKPEEKKEEEKKAEEKKPEEKKAEEKKPELDKETKEKLRKVIPARNAYWTLYNALMNAEDADVDEAFVEKLGQYVNQMTFSGKELAGQELSQRDRQMYESGPALSTFPDFLKEAKDGKTNYQRLKEMVPEDEHKIFDDVTKNAGEALGLGIDLEELGRAQEAAEKEAEKEGGKEEPDAGRMSAEAEALAKAKKLASLSVVRGLLQHAASAGRAIPLGDGEDYQYKRDALPTKLEEYAEAIDYTMKELKGVKLSAGDRRIRSKLPSINDLNQFLNEERQQDMTEDDRKNLEQQGKAVPDTRKSNFLCIMELLPDEMQQQLAGALNDLSESYGLSIPAQELAASAQEAISRERAETFKKVMGFDREEEKSALAWIEREQDVFKKNRLDKLEPNKLKQDKLAFFAESCARIMAARNLSNAERHKSSSLGTPMNWDKLAKETDDLMRNETFQKFMESVSKDPELAKKVQKAIVKGYPGGGHAGGLEDVFKEYVRDLPPGELSNDPLLKRYMPTAKERIESLKNQAKTAGENMKTDRRVNMKQGYRNIQKQAAAEIIQLRTMVKAEWGVKKSVDKPIPVQSLPKHGEPGVPSLAEQVKNMAKDKDLGPVLGSNEVQSLMEKGHGGQMVKKVRDSLTLHVRDKVPAIDANSIGGQIAAVQKQAKELAEKMEKSQSPQDEQKVKELAAKLCVLVEAAGPRQENIHRDAPWNAMGEVENPEKRDKALCAMLGKNLNTVFNRNPAGVLAVLSKKTPQQFREFREKVNAGIFTELSNNELFGHKATQMGVMAKHLFDLQKQQGGQKKQQGGQQKQQANQQTQQGGQEKQVGGNGPEP